jgi:hypothetical protein
MVKLGEGRLWREINQRVRKEMRARDWKGRRNVIRTLWMWEVEMDISICGNKERMKNKEIRAAEFREKMPTLSS